MRVAGGLMRIPDEWIGQQVQVHTQYATLVTGMLVNHYEHGIVIRLRSGWVTPIPIDHIVSIEPLIPG